MRTRHLVQSVAIAAVLCSAMTVNAASKRFSYNTYTAVAYALGNAYTPYGSRSGQNPFYDFGDNCANFVSQAIIAGMTMKTSPAAVYDRRYDFTADAGASLAWYFIDGRQRGPAWAGANELYKYARDNKSTWKGLHFFPVGSDSVSNRSLNPLSLQQGDIVFANWDGNATYDHAMIVTGINYSLFVWNKYDRILVTYQSGEKGPELNRSLQFVIDKDHKRTNKWATFSVYRPIDYNQAGK